MLFVLLGAIGGIISIFIGTGVFLFGKEERRCTIKVIGILMICVGTTLFILALTPTENYTEWKEVTGKTIITEMEDGQYLIEAEDGYIYKEVTYSGENIPEYVVIKKDESIFVESTENKLSDEAYMVIFTRYAKNGLGQKMSKEDNKQTRYIFYIP